MGSARSTCSRPLLVFLLGLFCGACYSSYSPAVPREVAFSCPDFSGEYRFGGSGDSQCRSEKPSPWDKGLPLPTDQGFAVVEYPASVVLRQTLCEDLAIAILPESPSPRAWEQQGHVDLVRSHRADEVRWEENAVFMRRKIKMVGPIIVPLPGVAYMETYIAKQADGTILLRAAFTDSAPGGAFEKRYQRECLLPAR